MVSGRKDWRKECREVEAPEVVEHMSQTNSLDEGLTVYMNLLA